jgi:hypothetical protein
MIEQQENAEVGKRHPLSRSMRILPARISPHLRFSLFFRNPASAFRFSSESPTRQSLPSQHTSNLFKTNEDLPRYPSLQSGVETSLFDCSHASEKPLFLFSRQKPFVPNSNALK